MDGGSTAKVPRAANVALFDDGLTNVLPRACGVCMAGADAIRRNGEMPVE